MKKFLMFLVSIIVVVSIGLTTYYFLRNDEVISIRTNEIYCNVGDVVTLDDIGITIKKPTNRTEFDYNAGGTDVTSLVNYNADLGYYVVGNKGGNVNVVIKTTNKNYEEIKFLLHIGDGSKDFPYYIFNENDLKNIGVNYANSAYYSLHSDIILSDDFMPLCIANGFSGNFNGNGHIISNLNLTSNAYADAGLFAKISANGVVSDLYITNSTIAGEYNNAGLLAGTIDGTISKIRVENSTITNDKATASKTGAIAGKITNSAKMCYAENVEINAKENATDVIVGGIFAEIDQATIQACYSNLVNITLTNVTGSFGGFAGKFIIGTNEGSIQQSYANAKSNNANLAGFIGTIEKATGFDASVATELRYLIGNVAVVEGNAVVGVNNSGYYAGGYYTAGKYYIDQVTEQELLTKAEFVFYGKTSLDKDKVMWDNLVWTIQSLQYPQLKMGANNPSMVDADYLRRDLTAVEVNNSNVTNLLSADIIDKKLVMVEDIDLTGKNYTPIKVIRSTIDGGNHTIKGLDIKNSATVGGTTYAGLFSVVDNSSISKLNVEINSVTANAKVIGGFAGKIYSSDATSISVIDNVKVTYKGVDTVSCDKFGGFAGIVEKTNIINSSVTGLNLYANTTAGTVAGMVAELKNDSKLENNKVKFTSLYGKNIVAGLVGDNASTINNCEVEGKINFAQTTAANIAGLVGVNNSIVENCKATVDIKINKANAVINVGGVAAINNGQILDNNIYGNEISLSEDIANTVNIGGLVATNNNTIKTSNCYIKNIGSCHLGKEVRVGGLVADNNTDKSKIYQCIVTSNIYGNYVAGVAVKMNNTNATIDQVFVGKITTETEVVDGNTVTTRTFEENEIKGDKYVAGLCFEMAKGKITNVQATSKLNGATTTARVSLIVLIFPDGAKVLNSTINSSFDGYGIFYRDTWEDYGSSANVFGSYDRGVDNWSFNLYSDNAAAGEMQSVVINTEKIAGVDYIQAHFVKAAIIGVNYNDNAGSSFIKTVNNADFNNNSTFKGQFTLKADSWWFDIDITYTKTLSFELGAVWTEGNGITLAFMNK